ncbi:MAG: toll/interleukin-1 receptor domain-containing protein [Pseudodesulfovibrio sp.]
MKVFLSHSSEDKPKVREIAEFLKQNGIDSWIDEGEIKIGDRLLPKITSGVHETDLILAFLSTNSISSQWVQKELSLAMEREMDEHRIAILPILIGVCPIPQFIRDKLYADLVTESSYQNELRRVVSTINFYRSQPANVAELNGKKIDVSTTYGAKGEVESIAGQAVGKVGERSFNHDFLDRQRKRRDEAIHRMFVFGFIFGVWVPILGLLMPSSILRIAYAFGGGLVALACFFVGRGLSQTVDAMEDNPNLLATISKTGNSWVFSKKGWDQFAHFHDYRWGVRKMLLGCLSLGMAILSFFIGIASYFG